MPDNGTSVVRSITINCSPAEAYSYWRPENLYRFMTYVDEVTDLGNGMTHWKVQGPAGMDVEWDAEIVLDEPNRVIAWRSIGETQFENSGSVQFTDAPGGRGTKVRVEMLYDPTGGGFTTAISKLFGVDVGSQITHDLRNFKQLIEIGEVTHSDASIHRSKHPARPSRETERGVRRVA